MHKEIADLRNWTQNVEIFRKHFLTNDHCVEQVLRSQNHFVTFDQSALTVTHVNNSSNNDVLINDAWMHFIRWVVLFLFTNNSYLQFVKIYSEAKIIQDEMSSTRRKLKVFSRGCCKYIHGRKVKIYDAIVNDIKLGHTTEGWEKINPPMNTKVLLEMELAGLRRLKEDVEGCKISMWAFFDILYIFRLTPVVFSLQIIFIYYVNNSSLMDFFM